MSEKLHLQHESHKTDHTEIKRHHENIKRKLEKDASKTEHEHAKNLEYIRSRVESEAEHEPVKKHKELQNDSIENQPTFINKELKAAAYQRTLKKAQTRLSTPYRVFSKFIHQPVVETASEVAGKTVARPSGILTGGIMAFLGSSFFLWMAKYYGFEYNFLLFAVFFAGGFFLGLLIELVLRMVKR